MTLKEEMCMKNNLKILHVDDSRRIVEQIKALLLDTFEVDIQSAYDVSEAKNILQTEKIDVVVLDIRLPDGNGMELLKWIKTNYQPIRVIMFSNNSDNSNRTTSIENGAEYFLDKTTEFEQLTVILSDMISE